MSLRESTMPGDPLALFRRWYRESEAAGTLQPDAMTLATADARGRPSARMVLYKGLEAGGLLFYSNYESRKGRDLDVNPRAACVFFWPLTHHQVRFAGRVRRLSRRASFGYFQSRDRAKQLAASASRQSRVLVDRATLDRAVHRLATEYPVAVPLPADWGGYRLQPDEIEFWEGRPDRLHDRLRYRRKGGAWTVERLAP